VRPRRYHLSSERDRVLGSGPAIIYLIQTLAVESNNNIETITAWPPTLLVMRSFSARQTASRVKLSTFPATTVLDPEIKAALPAYESESVGADDEDHIIVTGADAAAHLLPMRDDFDPALTFRSILLASVLAAFQAVVYQIYQVPSVVGYCSPRTR
jgi:hypothetical protein